MTHLFNKFALSTLLIAVLYTILNWQAFESFIYSPSLNMWYTKWFLLLPLIVGFVLWHFLSLLEKHPEWHEYDRLNSENKEYFYKNSSFVLYILKNSLLSFLSIKTMNDGVMASGHASLFAGYGQMITIIVSLCLIIYIVTYAAKVTEKFSKHLEH